MAVLCSISSSHWMLRYHWTHRCFVFSCCVSLFALVVYEAKAHKIRNDESTCSIMYAVLSCCYFFWILNVHRTPYSTTQYWVAVVGWCCWTTTLERWNQTVTHIFKFSVILILGFDVAVSLCDFPCVSCFSCCNWRGFYFKLEYCCIQKLLILINMLKSISFCAWFLLGFNSFHSSGAKCFSLVFVIYIYINMHAHTCMYLCLNRKQNYHIILVQRKSESVFINWWLLDTWEYNIDGV